MISVYEIVIHAYHVSHVSRNRLFRKTRCNKPVVAVDTEPVVDTVTDILPLVGAAVAAGHAAAGLPPEGPWAATEQRDTDTDTIRGNEIK